jgi:uncharacterized Zn finger protein
MKITVEIECPRCGDVKPYDYFDHEAHKFSEVICSECQQVHVIVVSPAPRKARRV